MAEQQQDTSGGQSRFVLIDEDAKYVLCNTLLGCPLYAFYVIVIATFKPGDIEGALMTCPFEVYGPYETYGEAMTQLRNLRGE